MSNSKIEKELAKRHGPRKWTVPVIEPEPTQHRVQCIKCGSVAPETASPTAPFYCLCGTNTYSC